MDMNAQKRTSVFRLWRILFPVILLIFSSFGVICAAEHPSPGNTTIKPAFALPCSSTDTCRQLDSCADVDFGECRGFKGVSGLRRLTSGSLGTLGFRAQIVDSKTGEPASLWHDVPLVVSDDEKGFVVKRLF